MNTRRELWRAKHGPIPKGWLVVPLNGSNEDNRLENLACIPRNPDNMGQAISPFKVRIWELERLLKESKEKN